MTRWIGSRYAMVLGVGILALYAPSQATAQLPSEPAEISACLCLEQASGGLAADKDTKAQALAAVNRQLADLDAQLAAERPRVQVGSNV